MKIDQFTKKAIDKFTADITDNLFILIQNDKELMQDYLNLLENNKRNVVNSSIAKAIKDSYNLDNSGESQNPKSTLIKTFEQFKIKQWKKIQPLTFSRVDEKAPTKKPLL